MSIVLFLFRFFFYCYSDLQDLHSFPTRRSSDLIGTRVPRNTGVPPRISGFLTMTPIPEIVSRAIVVGARANGSLLDRKSTRLNSSHLGISYAVFCLKKKKEEHVGRQ